MWTEITSLGQDIRAEDPPEAFVVVQGTMQRVRRNVERLVELLPGIGYVFESGDQPVFEPPSSDIMTNSTS